MDLGNMLRKKGMSKVSLMLCRKNNIMQVFYLGNTYALGTLNLKQEYESVPYTFYVLSDSYEQWKYNCHAAHSWIERQTATGNSAC